MRRYSCSWTTASRSPRQRDGCTTRNRSRTLRNRDRAGGSRGLSSKQHISSPHIPVLLRPANWRRRKRLPTDENRDGNAVVRCRDARIFQHHQVIDVPVNQCLLSPVGPYACISGVRGKSWPWQWAVQVLGRGHDRAFFLAQTWQTMRRGPRSRFRDSHVGATMRRWAAKRAKGDSSSSLH